MGIVKTVKVKELKITRGYSLSRANTMALRAEYLDRELAKGEGEPAGSVSLVLDEIVTEWRKGREKRDAERKKVKA